MQNSRSVSIDTKIPSNFGGFLTNSSEKSGQHGFITLQNVNWLLWSGKQYNIQVYSRFRFQHIHLQLWTCTVVVAQTVNHPEMRCNCLGSVTSTIRRKRTSCLRLRNESWFYIALWKQTKVSLAVASSQQSDSISPRPINIPEALMEWKNLWLQSLDWLMKSPPAQGEPERIPTVHIPAYPFYKAHFDRDSTAGFIFERHIFCWGSAHFVIPIQNIVISK